MAKIAFLGIGNMGRGMALRLAGAGHEVTVWNRTRARAEELGSAVRVADTPIEAAEGAEAIFAIVADDPAAIAAWYGSDSALAAKAEPGCFAIECSTISHDHALRFAEKARDAGFRPIDCPVMGLPDQAAAGELMLLVGAAADDLKAAAPFLDPISNSMVHFGGPGTGTAYKLLINMMGAVQIAAAAEGMLIAERAGLDLAQVAQTLLAGQSASPQLVRNVPRMVANDHGENIIFSGALRAKDARYGVALAKSLGFAPALGEAAEAAFKLLDEQGTSGLNESQVFEAMKAATKS
jgi:3-hydroxyisobutyrate dehydrogenase